MSDEQYLKDVLAAQCLADDSDEMKALREARDRMQALLEAEFSGCNFTIRYGGSKAKRTLIREMYDLDIVFYVHSGENGVGDTLKDIFTTVAKALRKDYVVEEKTSALRLKAKEILGPDLHIDVVPGRYTDDTKTDCYLYQNGSDKERLKTNLQTHIAHIRDSGVVDAICLLKLLRVRRNLPIKQFVWELLAVELLADQKKASLPDQLDHVLKSIADAEAAIKVEDPANPSGNDLMPILESAWSVLKSTAKDVRATVDASGWEAVYGEVASKSARVGRLTAAVQSARTPVQPWDFVWKN
ncbi:MAG: hypothetical protein WAU68_00880 [Vitreimonas sp.]